jgi:hypothetical protein
MVGLARAVIPYLAVGEAEYRLCRELLSAACTPTTH